MLDVLRVALLVLAGLVLLMTALPFVRTTAWWVRMFDFPRLQIAALGLVAFAGLTAVALATGEGGTLVLAALALVALAVAAQAARMWPYSPLSPVQTADAEPDSPRERRLRLVMTNVLMENRDGERWARVVRAARPDVVVAVETDAWWIEQIGRALGDDFPHRVELPQPNTYGMGVYSRFPLEDARVEHLVEEEVPSVFVRVALPSGCRVQGVFLHPRPPRPDIQQDSTFRDAELVLAAEAIEDGPRPVVVAGDLNDVAWSHTTTLFQKLSGLLDPRRGRGLFSTFHADHALLRYPLDHVFHSDDLTLVELRRLGNVGSDHFPLLVEFAHEPPKQDRQQAPAAEGDDRAEAAETVEEVRAEKAHETEAEHEERDQEDR